ncbi:MAG: hypothetical protein JST66_04715 [Bacteroidetes bacterium]|nr:hypothetical protein [Bacteroidota bacterium]
MIRSITTLALFGLILSHPALLDAQETYWGMTSRGGVNNAGTIYTVTTGGVFTKKFDFQLNGGQALRSDLLKATDGKYYGVTAYGGDNGLGTLFRFDPATNAYNVLFYMTATSGSYPDRGLVQAPNGKLYGVCRNGGANSKGTLFEYNITTSTFTKRADFNGTNGQTPRGRMALAANGKLYGTTELGGTNNVGVVFEFDPATNALANRFSLASATGSGPATGPIAASNGLLYGVTQGGGSASVGTLYSFNPTGFVYTKLVDMSVANGTAPIAELVQAVDGLLYGTASAGGANGNGTLFRYDIATPAFSKRYDFAAASGSMPLGRMVQAADGLLYGMTSSGGTASKGVLYSFDPATSTYTAVRMLALNNIANPYAGLLEDPAGTFVGGTDLGGSFGQGVIFKYVPATSTYTELAAIGFSSGSYPWGSLTRASNGLFYGLTSAGGLSNGGVLFSYDPATSTYTRLIDLGGGQGKYPYGGMVAIGNTLYGVCNQGGEANEGTLFAYDIPTNLYTVKVNFSGTTGTRPQAGLMLASNGQLYGTCSEGGTAGYGTLFRYTPGAASVMVVRQLVPADGTSPIADPVQGSDGLLYGTLSEFGSYGGGAIYRIDPATNVFTHIADLETDKGTAPSGKLVEVSAGKFYGTTAANGTNLNGTIFSCIVSIGLVTKELDLTTTQGNGSDAGLLKGSDGLLYGTCAGGGASQFGTVFRFNPSNSAYTVLRALNTPDGVYPHDGLVKETIPAAANVQLSAKVLLDGPLNPATGLMGDGLRTLAAFPLTEPYTGLGFTQVGGGGETIAAGVLAATGNNAIVDWVLVELRSKSNAATVQRTRCALLQRDGDIVDVDGVSPVAFPMAPDDYYVAVRHRNHFGVCTLAAVTFGGSPVGVDFTTAAQAAYGTNARRSNGAYLTLWAGNVVRDNLIKYTGASNDRDPILVRVGGSIPTAVVSGGYWMEDVNMDATVKYTGASNDRDPILVTVGGSIPTATRTQQLP